MNPSEFVELAIMIFGERGWQTDLAEALKVDESTVRLWVSGSAPIPGRQQQRYTLCLSGPIPVDVSSTRHASCDLIRLGS